MSYHDWEDYRLELLDKDRKAIGDLDLAIGLRWK